MKAKINVSLKTRSNTVIGSAPLYGRWQPPNLKKITVDQIRGREDLAVVPSPKNSMSI